MPFYQIVFNYEVGQGANEVASVREITSGPGTVIVHEGVQVPVFVRNGDEGSQVIDVMTNEIQTVDLNRVTLTDQVRPTHKLHPNQIKDIPVRSYHSDEAPDVLRISGRDADHNSMIVAFFSEKPQVGVALNMPHNKRLESR